MADLVAEAFTNEFGQTIQPGDEVVYVGTGYGHSVRVRTGKFAGVYYTTGRAYIKDEKGQYVRDEKGNAKYEMKQLVKAVRVDGIPSKKYDYKTRQYTDTIRCAILPLKRVYKIDMAMKDIAGKSL
jgi:hypothetical protein